MAPRRRGTAVAAKLGKAWKKNPPLPWRCQEYAVRKSLACLMHAPCSPNHIGAAAKRAIVMRAEDG
jgi:hypothetical protein